MLVLKATGLDVHGLFPQVNHGIRSDSGWCVG